MRSILFFLFVAFSATTLFCAATTPCSPNPCVHGSCNTLSGNNFNCTCSAGWSGMTCNTTINYCQDITCAHGGNCVNGVSSYSCNCPVNWVGPTCLTPNITCATGYQWVVSNNTLGFTCIPNVCTNDHPCQLDETCLTTHVLPGSECICDNPNGCYGTNSTNCEPNPCHNGGICHTPNNSTDWACDCSHTRFHGPVCQFGSAAFIAPHLAILTVVVAAVMGVLLF